MSDEPAIIRTGAELERVASSASAAPLIGVDAEGNGLFAYRARLCALQISWLEQGETRIAIVDTLEANASILSQLLGPGGPIKVLHDFTFDVKLLADAGIALANLRDTSVLARMLGRKATGLASLLSSELGIVVQKELQQHDWSKRPLGAKEIEYLAGDVRHLLALYEKLSELARAADIVEEVDTECAFKYDMAIAPPREKKPAYLRIKGTEVLDPVGLAVLRRLVEERERLAEQWDVPPFKVAGNDLLLILARARPKSLDDLGHIRRGISSRLMGAANRIVAAVLAGEEDRTVPAADRELPPRLDKAILAERRAREKRLTAWRRQVAAERGVDEQVVLPGHCLQDMLDLDGSDLDAIARVPGMGQKRYQRYAAAIAGALAPLPIGPGAPQDGTGEPKP
jgi:ribonuclease D